MIIDIIMLILLRETTESHSFCVDVVNKRIIKQQGTLDMKQQPTTKCHTMQEEETQEKSTLCK